MSECPPHPQVLDPCANDSVSVGLSDMFPDTPFIDSANGRSTNPEFSRQSPSLSWCFGNLSANVSHIFLGKNVHSVSFSEGMSSFVYFVSGVDLRATKKQMVWVDASAIIATVANQNICRDSNFVSKLIRQTMRPAIISYSSANTNPKNSVSKLHYTALPLPAFIRATFNKFVIESWQRITSFGIPAFVATIFSFPVFECRWLNVELLSAVTGLNWHKVIFTPRRRVCLVTEYGETS